MTKNKKVYIQTFSGFNIYYGNKALSDNPIRRGKMWLVLEYMIAHYKRPISATELIDLLWPNDECENPTSSLNTMVYRLRKILSKYINDFKCIDFAHGQYIWNPNIECVIDTIEFERLIVQARNEAQEDEKRVALYNKALDIYKGDFLRGENNEMWLISFVNYYKRLYYKAVDELATLYELKGAYDDVVSLYGEAIRVEPYEESLYEKQISLLIQLGEYENAKNQYQSISKILKNEFDTKPSMTLQGLYKEICAVDKSKKSDLNELKFLLEDDKEKKSALLCGPETFKKIYCYDKYLDERMHFAFFLAMITIEYKTDSSKNSVKLRSLMKLLRNIILKTLRQCDIVCQYSSNQFVLMLTATDDENKMIPITRIIKIFENSVDTNEVALHTQVESIRGEKDDFSIRFTESG